MRKWSREDLKSIARQYDRLLRLRTYAVAVKLFEDAKELDEVRDEKGKPVRRPKPYLGERLAVCQLWAQARYWGTVVGATAEAISFCEPGAAAMGFKELRQDFPGNYVGAYYVTTEIAKKALATMPRFEPGKYAAMIASPLERAPVDPDVVIFFGNPAQVIRFAWAYLYDKGGELQFSTCGMWGCADAAVTALQTRKPSIAFLCMGGRLLSCFSEDEVACGVPSDILEDVLKGMEFNQAGGASYPVPWQGINMEPWGFIRRVLTTGFLPPEERERRG